MIKLTLPKATPSLNRFTFRHWRVQSSAKKDWAIILLAAIGAQREKYRATGKRRLTVVRFGVRLLDYDNLVGGMKSCVIDNLRKFGLLLDDSPDMMELVALQEKTPKGVKAHSVLTLEDM